MSWLPGWYYRRPITISSTSVDEDLIHFPLRVSLSQADVPGELATGADFRFAAADGITLLPYVWTGWADDGYSGAYVKVPSISSSGDTTIYLYYGNPSAIDASDLPSVLSDYALFWPGYNWTSGQQELAQGLAVTQGYGTSTPVAGGVDLGGFSDLHVGSTAMDIWNVLAGARGCLLSVVLKDISWPGSGNAGITRSGTNNMAPWFDYAMWNTGRLEFKFLPQSGTLVNVATVTGITSGTDRHVATSIQYQAQTDMARSVTWVDGISKSDQLAACTASVISPASTGLPWTIGNLQWSIDAVISQVRLKKYIGESTAQIAAWMKFEHANLMSAGGQIDLETEESLPTVPGPYGVDRAETFQTGAHEAEIFTPGIFAGNTHAI